jgi:hypothetical protein
LNAHRTQACPGRRPAAGNALLEFILTLPIVVFVAGLTIYMSMAMLTRQQALFEARHVLVNSANTDHGWSSMKLETWLPGLNRPHPNENLPRGTGEELDRLRADIYNDTFGRCSNALARSYGDLIWSNLPGRREVNTSASFTTNGRMWDFIEKTATAYRTGDSSPWYYHDLDTWQMARASALQEIFKAFYNGLQGQVAPHFQPTRDDLIQRWWHYRPGYYPD